MFFAITAPGGAAWAQTPGCDFSECPPPGEELPNEGEQPTTPPGGELPNEGEAPGGGEAGAPGEAETGGGGEVAAGGAETGAAGAAAPSGTLPVTGGDIAGLALIGAGAVAAGAVLVRRSRRADAAA